MLSIFRCLAAVSAVLLLMVAHQAQADDSAAYTAFLNTPNLKQNVVNSASRSIVIVQNPCAEAQYWIATSPIILKPMAFDGSGGPVAGLLKYPVKEEGCGASRILNVFIVVQGPKQVAAIASLPGGTHADPVLQRDAIPNAVIWAGSAVEKEDTCKARYVSDTEFLGYETPAPGAKASSWRERWTIALCDKKVAALLTFTPDATGTSFMIGKPVDGAETAK